MTFDTYFPIWDKLNDGDQKFEQVSRDDLL